jgi:sugar phosphate permease
VDRRSAVPAPALKDQYHRTNTDFATVLSVFRVVYTIMQLVSGRLLDPLGGFRVFRGLLGAGESAG